MRQLLLATIVVTALTVHGAEPLDLDFVTASSLPRAVLDALSSSKEQLSRYVLSAHINPYYLHGDFDGDDSMDTAIWLQERTTGKAGILIIRGATGSIVVVGAGQPFSNRGDDFGGMDAWYIYPRGKVGRGADGRDPPQLLGDALMLVKTEAASGLLYWTGSEYAWYQQGD